MARSQGPTETESIPQKRFQRPKADHIVDDLFDSEGLLLLLIERKPLLCGSRFHGDLIVNPGIAITSLGN